MDLILDPATAGSLYLHAERSAQALDVAVARKRHYFAVLDELNQSRALPEMPGVIRGWHAAKDEQMISAARDLHALAEAAAQQRSNRTTPLPKLELRYDAPMRTPDPNDRTAVVAAFIAMNNLLAGALRDAADCIEWLVPWMRRGKVSTDVRALATEVDELARMIRPDGLPPGPYAVPDS
jgi:hypothetical protein